jgi:hypothetical protein
MADAIAKTTMYVDSSRDGVVQTQTTIERNSDVSDASYIGLAVHEFVHVQLTSLRRSYNLSEEDEETICYGIQDHVTRALDAYGLTHTIARPVRIIYHTQIKETDNMNPEIEYESPPTTEVPAVGGDHAHNVTKAAFLFASTLLTSAFKAGTVAASPASAYDASDRAVLEQCDALFAMCQNAVVDHITVTGPQSKAAYDELAQARRFIAQQLQTSRGR